MTSAAATEGRESQTNPRLALAFVTIAAVAFVAQPVQGADVNVDVFASQEIRDIYPTVLGGNEVYTYSSNLWLMYDMFKDNGLSKMGWRVHVLDDAFGLHWDNNIVDERSNVFTYSRNGLDGPCKYYVPPDGCYNDVSGGNSSNEMIDYDEGNKFIVDYWGEATDMSHSGLIVKTVNADDAYLRLLFNDNPADPLYARLDVKIDSARPFRSEDSGWVLLSNGANLDVRFTPNRELMMTCRDAENQFHTLAVSAPLNFDQYYSLEINYGNNECGYWLDGTLVDNKQITTRPAQMEIAFGAIESGLAGVEGQIHVDAVRVDDTYIGANVQYPWRYPYKAVFTFDNNLRSIDDLAKMSERLGVTLLWGIPVPNKNRPGYVENTDNNGWDFETPQYYLDMIEYLDGVADADFAARAQTLDWTHNTPADNWANLRAARGREVPYNEIYFEFGNEPYYAGGWRWKDDSSGSVVYVDDLDGYGAAFVAFAKEAKAINSEIKLGCHFMAGGPYNDWLDKLLPITHDDIGFLSVFHYYLYYKNYTTQEAAPVEFWLGAPVGENNSYKYYLGNNRPEWVEAPYGRDNPVEGADHKIYLPYYARFKAQEHLADRGDADTIPLATTEYGFFRNAGYGEDNWLGTALHRASWIESHIKSGVQLAFSWSTLVSQRFGHGLVVLHNTAEGGIEVTPSYYVFKMIADHLGSKLLYSEQISAIPPYEWGDSTSASGHEIPYVSSWASTNDARDKVYVTFINRSQTDAYEATVNLFDFLDSRSVKVFMVNGDCVCCDNEITNDVGRYTSWCPTSDGNYDPNNITMKEYTAPVRDNVFSYTLPKLSVTVFETSDEPAPEIPDKPAPQLGIGGKASLAVALSFLVLFAWSRTPRESRSKV